jgi:hypothetical protein
VRHHDLVVIGTGTGNSIVDERFAHLDVALVEHGVFGGTCLNVGCIPTKMYVYAADVAQAVRHASRYGVDATVDKVRWTDIRDRVFGRIDSISAGGREYRIGRCPNVTVYEGHARFTGHKELTVARTDGSGTDAAPPIDEVTIAELDLSIRTGRMPLADPNRGVRERELTDAEREATVAYLTDVLDLDGEIEDPGVGDVADGREVYTLHCAQCHGARGHGGIAGDGTFIPAVTGVDPLVIAPATRVGPFRMPPFGEELVTDEELADLAAALAEEVHAPLSPLGLGELERPEAAMFAVVLTVSILALCVWSGRRAGVREVPVEPPDEAAGGGPPPDEEEDER